MAKLTIVDTSKSGWITYTWNDYYTDNVCTHKVQYERKESITAVDIIKVGGNECVEIMNAQDFNTFLTFEDSSQFFKVDSVNGVAPTSLSDLRDKLLALL